MIDQVEELFEAQLAEWPLLRSGVEALEAAATRSLDVDGSEVLARHIPHRISSTTAAVDPEAIRKRPCFLCAANLPPEERGLPFGDTTVYCNPFPVVERHLTIVHREHRPQRIEGQIGTVLDLASQLPGFVVVYNGPECGASAPDHLHLQAGRREGLPVVEVAGDASGPGVTEYASKFLLFRGRDRSRIGAELARAIDVLARFTGRSPEPWINLAVFIGRGAIWTACLFPRTRHRPQAFHTGELTVSPAAFDLCGLLVVPLLSDFERITPEQVGRVYRDVTMPDEELREVASRIARAR